MVKLFALVVASRGLARRRRANKKGRWGECPGSLVDVSKSSHKSNKRKTIITQVLHRV